MLLDSSERWNLSISNGSEVFKANLVSWYIKLSHMEAHKNNKESSLRCSENLSGGNSYNNLQASFKEWAQKDSSY